MGRAREEPAATVLNLMEWLRRKLVQWALRPRDFHEPVWVDRIRLVCPACGKGGMWAVPPGFSLTFGHMTAGCECGAFWSVEPEKIGDQA
jgi:hypothetical protein